MIDDDKFIWDCEGLGVKLRQDVRNFDARNLKYNWIKDAQALSQQSVDSLLPKIKAQN